MRYNVYDLIRNLLDTLVFKSSFFSFFHFLTLPTQKSTLSESCNKMAEFTEIPVESQETGYKSTHRI